METSEGSVVHSIDGDAGSVREGGVHLAPGDGAWRGGGRVAIDPRALEVIDLVYLQRVALRPAGQEVLDHPARQQPAVCNPQCAMSFGRQSRRSELHIEGGMTRAVPHEVKLRPVHLRDKTGERAGGVM